CAGAPRNPCRSSRRLPSKPRRSAMAMVSAVPANSHGADVASVTRMPSAAEVPPEDEISLASTQEKKNASGGDTTTVSRSLGLAYQAIAPQPATNSTSATIPVPSQPDARTPRNDRMNSPRTAPRPVSRRTDAPPPAPDRASLDRASPGRASPGAGGLAGRGRNASRPPAPTRPPPPAAPPPPR